MTKKTRPTKKQFELLAYLKEFIDQHGYSPSYREIMRGCNYTSVATVALHVNNLISRGHLQKRDKSARSLEVVEQAELSDTESRVASIAPHLDILVAEVEKRFKQLEISVEEEIVNEAYVLVGALKVLGHSEVHAYATRLNDF